MIEFMGEPRYYNAVKVKTCFKVQEVVFASHLQVRKIQIYLKQD